MIKKSNNKNWPYKRPRRELIIGVYQIKDLVNNKLYIGSSIDILARIANHKSCRCICGVMSDVCSVSKLEFNVLDICQKEELRERELFWIKKLNTMTPNGYNKKHPITNKLFVGSKNKRRINNYNFNP